jgi:multiple sugar transport system ATP-binding protein
VQEVVIDLVQPTGSRLYGTFMLGGQEVVAELGAHDVSRPGERVNLLFDMNRAILIDPQTERVL